MKSFSNVIRYRPTCEIQQPDFKYFPSCRRFKNERWLAFRKEKKKIQVSPHFLNENFLAAAKFPDTRSHECVVLRDRKN